MRVRYLIYVQNKTEKKKREKKEKNPPKIILPAVYTITSSLSLTPLTTKFLPTKGRKMVGKKETWERKKKGDSRNKLIPCQLEVMSK